MAWTTSICCSVREFVDWVNVGEHELVLVTVSKQEHLNYENVEPPKNEAWIHAD